MSCSTLYKVYKTKVSAYRQFRNGHGTAAVLWTYLCDKYLNGAQWYLERDSNRLWALYNNMVVPEHMRFGLMATFDNAIIEVSDLAKASDLAAMVYETIYDETKVNHWKELSHTYMDLCKTKDKRIVGIGLGCTSVSDPWENFETRKPWSVMRELESQTLTAADAAAKEGNE